MFNPVNPHAIDDLFSNTLRWLASMPLAIGTLIRHPRVGPFLLRRRWKLANSSQAGPYAVLFVAFYVMWRLQEASFDELIGIVISEVHAGTASARPLFAATLSTALVVVFNRAIIGKPRGITLQARAAALERIVYGMAYVLVIWGCFYFLSKWFLYDFFGGIPWPDWDWLPRGIAAIPPIIVTAMIAGLPIEKALQRSRAFPGERAAVAAFQIQLLLLMAIGATGLADRRLVERDWVIATHTSCMQRNDGGFAFDAILKNSSTEPRFIYVPDLRLAFMQPLGSRGHWSGAYELKALALERPSGTGVLVPAGGATLISGYATDSSDHLASLNRFARSEDNVRCTLDRRRDNPDDYRPILDLSDRGRPIGPTTSSLRMNPALKPTDAPAERDNF